MRFQGKIKSWNQSKGFGFISPNGGGEDVFIHISEFKYSRRQPKINSLVTYEINLDEKKRRQAANAKYVDEKENKPRRTLSPKTLLHKLWTMFMFSLIAYLIVYLYQNRSSTVDATFYKTLYLRDSNLSEYKCEGKTHCSQMKSCTEAMFYQEKCSGTEMDGNGDGIPCEQQWCN